MHVLGVAGIHDGNGIAINGVCEVPFVGVGHVVSRPSADSRLASQKGPFYLIHGIICIIGVFMHQLLGVRVLVLLGDVAIERGYLLGATLFDNISI